MNNTSDSSRVTRKGQIVIPAHLRKKMGITAGTRLTVTDDGLRIFLQIAKPISEADFKKAEVEIAASVGEMPKTMLVKLLCYRTGLKPREVKARLFGKTISD